MNITKEIRLLICGLLMSLIIEIAPKRGEEGERIIKVIHFWAEKEIKLREAERNAKKTNRNSRGGD